MYSLTHRPRTPPAATSLAKRRIYSLRARDAAQIELSGLVSYEIAVSDADTDVDGSGRPVRAD